MLYIDTSAAMKMVRIESESAALTAWLRARPDAVLVSSVLIEIELVRAVRRATPEALVRVPPVVAGLDLFEIDDAVRARAAALDPTTLRSLDAIHLATALELGDEADGLLAYDERLGRAAEAAGLGWHAPGASDQ